MSTTDLAQQVADLTAATTQLTQEVVGQKSRLTAAADTATSKASDASGSASAASASATSANAAAAAAETSKNEAAEISGLDTVEEAIDLTLSKTLGLMTETEAMAQADAYEQVFAASGMVHMGKHRNRSTNDPINEGLFTKELEADSLGVGFPSSGSGVVGESKTDFPVTYIAGAVTNIINMNWGISNGENVFNLPPAEAGTRIYDSTGNARLSGKASIDLRYEPDPKYGNAPTGTEAEILREAVGRAFEGICPNGDQRTSDLSGWTIAGNQTAISDGVLTIGTTISQSSSAYPNIDFTGGTEYEISFYVPATGDKNLRALFPDGSNEIFTDEGHYTRTITANGTDRLIFNFQGGSIPGTTTVSTISVRPETEEVVTHPVDLLTWESYDEELTGRTEVFECIQSLSTTFGDTDVPTVLSTRPNSYFDQYDGQSEDPDGQNTQYRCVVWDDLTDEQKRKVAAYMGNKLYIGENGYLVNRRLRARTFRGLGNGDWSGIDSTGTGNTDILASVTMNAGRVAPQGLGDKPFDVLSGSHFYAPTGYTQYNTLPVKGVFTSRAAWTAYKGRCFLYVVASVPRANQGGYAKGLNEFGTKQFTLPTVKDGNWYEFPDRIKTMQDCFIEADYNANTFGIRPASGSIGRVSGHPDGISYDGITAGGLNGVIDWRLSAFEGDSPEEAAKVQAKVENKTYRGLEALKETRIITGTNTGTVGSVTRLTIDVSAYFVGVGDPIYIQDSNGDYHAAIVTGTNSTSYIDFTPASTAGFSNNPLAVITSESDISVSGEFSTSMVIGDPANILQTDALKDGWLGTWGGMDGGGSNKALTRKRIGSGSIVSLPFTDDNGATWQTTGVNYNDVTNEVTWTIPVGRVAIVNYKAYAKVTKPSENKAVYNGKAGLMPVFATSDNRPEFGCTFFESLFGKVFKSQAYHTGGHLTLLESVLYKSGRMPTSGELAIAPVHSPMFNLGTSNGSQGGKVLPYQISDNGQCSIGYQANELTYGTTTVIDVTGSSITSDVAINEIFHITGAAEIPTGFYLKVNSQGNNTFDTFPRQKLCNRQPNGDYVGSNGDLIWKLIGQELTWGDDGKIKVTTDGSDTFVDLNGNTNLSVAHELVIPHGWTKNRARAGEQVAGVDL